MQAPAVHRVLRRGGRRGGHLLAHGRLDGLVRRVRAQGARAARHRGVEITDGREPSPQRPLCRAGAGARGQRAAVRARPRQRGHNLLPRQRLREEVQGPHGLRRVRARGREEQVGHPRGLPHRGLRAELRGHGRRAPEPPAVPRAAARGHRRGRGRRGALLRPPARPRGLPRVRGPLGRRLDCRLAPLCERTTLPVESGPERGLFHIGPREPAIAQASTGPGKGPFSCPERAEGGQPNG